MTKPNVFQLIDLDRTLFDTAAFVKALTDEINLTHPGLGTQLDERFETAYAKEETFFLLRHLRHEKGDAWFEALVEQVIRKHGAQSFMLPGMRERLAFAEELSSASPSWGILTYGDKIDQLMKMRIIGLGDAAVYLTHTPNKAEVLGSWKTNDGTFKLPAAFGGGVVEQLTLEDDKHRAFYNLPTGVVGLWVATPGSVTHGEGLNDIPGTVAVKSLAESVAYLQRFFQE